MDDLLVRVLTRLLRVHEELGPEAFEESAQRALIAIAHAVQFEANRRAGVEPARDPDVIPLPLPGSRPRP